MRTSHSIYNVYRQFHISHLFDGVRFFATCVPVHNFSWKKARECITRLFLFLSLLACGILCGRDTQTHTHALTHDSFWNIHWQPQLIFARDANFTLRRQKCYFPGNSAAFFHCCQSLYTLAEQAQIQSKNHLENSKKEKEIFFIEYTRALYTNKYEQEHNIMNPTHWAVFRIHTSNTSFRTAHTRVYKIIIKKRLEEKLWTKVTSIDRLQSGTDTNMYIIYTQENCAKFAWFVFFPCFYLLNDLTLPFQPMVGFHRFFFSAFFVHCCLCCDRNRKWASAAGVEHSNKNII